MSNINNIDYKKKYLKYKNKYINFSKLLNGGSASNKSTIQEEFTRLSPIYEIMFKSNNDIIKRLEQYINQDLYRSGKKFDNSRKANDLISNSLLFWFKKKLKNDQSDDINSYILKIDNIIKNRNITEVPV